MQLFEINSRSFELKASRNQKLWWKVVPEWKFLWDKLTVEEKVKFGMQ